MGGGGGSISAGPARPSDRTPQQPQTENVATPIAINDASRPKPLPLSNGGPVSCAVTMPCAGVPDTGNVVDLALCEIPRGVEAHRHPQAAGQHVGGAEHDAGLDCNPGRCDRARVRVEKMCAPEQCRGHQQALPSCRRTPRASGKGSRGTAVSSEIAARAQGQSERGRGRKIALARIR